MLGSMGSGKTACMVREIVLNADEKTTFSNIIMKGKNKHKTVQINRDMIFVDKVVKVSAKGIETKKKVFNSEYWKSTRSKYPNGINVVIDEAHTLINSRRAMSSDNVIMNDFMSLLRRILGDSGEGYGELVLITQLGKRLDNIARDLATCIHYHRCHYKRTCTKCNFNFWETNEIYDKPKTCPRCSSRHLKKSNFIIEKWEFDSMDNLDQWLDWGHKRWKKHYYITDIEKYFKFYDTFQWENLISEY